MDEREYFQDRPDDIEDVHELSKDLHKWAEKQYKKNHSFTMVAEIMIVIGTKNLYRNYEIEEAEELIHNFVKLGFQFSGIKK